MGRRQAIRLSYNQIRITGKRYSLWWVLTHTEDMRSIDAASIVGLLVTRRRMTSVNFLVHLRHERARRFMARKRSSSHASGTSGVPPAPDVGGTPREGLKLPSRPGEFHPEPLTEPDVILSHHPALYRGLETERLFM